MTVTALIVAAGSGSRMGEGPPKQYREIGGVAVLRRAVLALADHPLIDFVDVVVAGDARDRANAVLSGIDVHRLVPGGAERSESVRNGLDGAEGDIVLVHDAARPFCPADVVDRLLDAIKENAAAVPVLPVSDTLARADGELGDGIDRSGAVRVQTPQAFRTKLLQQSYDCWTGPPPTDEASVVRAAGHRIVVVEGDPLLEKLTTPRDWALAETLQRSRMVSRVGMGFDVHAFEGPGPLMLGGIEIASDRGLAGHSDADVVLHALTDALLAAASMGDIGLHFPPSDPQWKGASSDRFLMHAGKLIRSDGGIIDHLDCTVICETPKVGPYREAMRERISDILGLRCGQVSIKATTTERLGFTGRGEGIAAQAVATIRMETP